MKDTLPMAEDSHSKRAVGYINHLSSPDSLLCVYIVDSFLGGTFPSWGIWKIPEAIQRDNSDDLKQQTNGHHHLTTSL